MIFFACAAVFALAACNSEAPVEPEAVQAQVALPIKPSMPAPDEELFAATYAEACGESQPVSGSLCKSQGFGKEGFVCEYGFGDDEYLRNETIIGFHPEFGASGIYVTGRESSSREMF